MYCERPGDGVYSTGINSHNGGKAAPVHRGGFGQWGLAAAEAPVAPCNDRDEETDNGTPDEHR